MEHVHVDNSDYAQELKEMLFSGSKFSVNLESGSPEVKTADLTEN